MKRTMKKLTVRLCLCLCLCLMMAYMLMPGLSLPVHAEAEECWVLQDVLSDTRHEEKYNMINTTLIYDEPGNVQIKLRDPDLTVDMSAHLKLLANELRPGDTATIGFDFDIQSSTPADDLYFAFQIVGAMWRASVPSNFEPQKLYSYVESESIEELEAWDLHKGYDSNGQGIGVIYAGVGSGERTAGKEIFRNDDQLTVTVPEGKAGQILVISIDYPVSPICDLLSGSPIIREDYIYTWATPTTQTIISEAGNEAGESGEQIETEIIKPGSNHGSSGNESGLFGGDDGGSLGGTIVKVGGAAAAAAVGVKVVTGLTGKSKGNGGKEKKKKKRKDKSGDDPHDDPQDEQKDQQNDEDEKKRYEMRVFKEFGDTIYAGKTVTLSARIVEISASGVERTVPELTQQIIISSNDMQVSGTFLLGQYQSAKVTAPSNEERPPSTAVVSFHLAAPGGSFTQHMRFKIRQADPMVVWPDLEVGALGHYLQIIAGDNDIYRIRFFFHDVDQEPEKIVFDPVDNYEITVEPADTMYTYWAVIRNRTAPLDNHKIYGKKDRSLYFSDSVGFTATFKDGLEMSSSIYLYRYPEGLSVVAKTKDNRIEVKAYQKEYYGDLDDPYQAVLLSYTCAHKTEDGVEIFNPKDEDLRYGKLQGDRGEKDNNVAMKYKYDVTASWFEPMDTLYESKPGDTYLMKLDVVWKKKPDDVLTLPLTFRLKPKTPMQKWQEEFDKLKEVVTKFSLPEEKEKNRARLALFTPGNTTPLEMRLMNEEVRKAYMEYWESEYNRQMNIDEWLADWVDKLGMVKFVGDCAFTYLVYYYATSCGCATSAPYIDAIGSAGKDIFCSLGGRCIGAWWDGEELYMDGFVKECTEAGKSALDDCIFEMIPDKPKAFFKSPSIKKVGVVIAAYMLVNFAINLTKIRYDMDDPEEQAKYAGMSEEMMLEETSWSNSVYAALIASFKDMSLRMITSIIGDRIEKYLDNPDIRKRIGRFIISIFDMWWKAEKKMHLASGTAMKYISRFSTYLYKVKGVRKEMVEKLAFGLRNSKSMYERSKAFKEWKEKAAKQVTEILDQIPEEQFAEVANMFFGKKEMKNYKLIKNGNLLPKEWVPEKIIQGGVIMDKIILKGAGYVYDLATGEVIEAKGDFDKENEGMVSAGEMDERVMEKRVQQKRAEKQAEELRAYIAKVTADIRNAETEEELENAIDQFLEKFDVPEEVTDVQEAEEDYEFDPTPDFKVGADGRMYVVMILRKPGTQQGYRIEYNLNKVFSEGLDNEVFKEFTKLFFGGILPDFPDKQAPVPSDPPLPDDLR